MAVKADRDLGWSGYCDSRKVGGYYQGSLRMKRRLFGGVFSAFLWCAVDSQAPNLYCTYYVLVYYLTIKWIAVRSLE